MSRKNLPVIIVAACFAIVFAASVFAAQAPAPAVQGAPAAAALQAPGEAPIQAPNQVETPAPGQCLPALAILPEPVLLKGNQTCDECLAYCEERELFCEQHCSGRDCGVKCPNQYFQCVDGCPC